MRIDVSACPQVMPRRSDRFGRFAIVERAAEDEDESSSEGESSEGEEEEASEEAEQAEDAAEGDAAGPSTSNSGRKPIKITLSNSNKSLVCHVGVSYQQPAKLQLWWCTCPSCVLYARPSSLRTVANTCKVFPSLQVQWSRVTDTWM